MGWKVEVIEKPFFSGSRKSSIEEASHILVEQ